MRKHGWQLPYHPLQVVAIAVFLALGFAFYVFFMPFVCKKVLEYVVMGIYTSLATSVFCLYVWCGATNPGDPAVFKSKKYLMAKGNRKSCNFKDYKEEAQVVATTNKLLDDEIKIDAMGENTSQRNEKKMSEDGMFYCCLCEVEVRKHSKHCRVCDKCVDHFDHHCRWLNNCIGRKNYWKFFVLMISAILLLVLQWSVGVLVLFSCFLDQNRYKREITLKLGSSFSLVPFTVVVASCTFLAMLATLPLAQLFLFHVLLIKKGISTYDYIVALREQEQQGVGLQSPQMSSVSSLTGFSSASSINAFQRASWCTPPRLFLEDQSDAIPQEINKASSNTNGKKTTPDEAHNSSTGSIKISTWALARLNADEVSKAAARARKKSKILQPIVKQIPPVPNPDDWGRSSNREIRLSTEFPKESSAKLPTGVSDINTDELASGLAPLQFEARSAFRSIRAVSSAMPTSSPDSSLESPERNPFRISSSGVEDSEGPISLPSASAGGDILRSAEFSRSTSDGYEASGGEDSDIVPSRIVHRSLNWSNVIFNSDRGERIASERIG